MMSGKTMGNKGTTSRDMMGDPIRPGSPRREKE